MTTKTATLATFLIVLCSISNKICKPALALPVPNILATQLEKHNQELSKVTLTWQISYQATPISLAQIKASAKWQFTRDGEAMLVEGDYPSYKGADPFSLEYFNNEEGLIAGTSSGTTSKIAILPPRVWMSEGRSIDYPAPVLGGLHVNPEQFALLAQTNPLKMYQAEWQLKSDSSGYTVLEGKGKQQSKVGPDLTILLTLDKKHGNVPSGLQIKADEQPWSANYQVTGFRQYGATWIGDEVKLALHAPGIADVSESWQLASLQNTQQLDLTIPPREVVADYRLLGKSITQQSLLQADKLRSHDIVYYPWQGKIVSVEELQALRNKQHPGEASPDPKQTSALPFAGGLMMLIGGVWMFRRRGSAS